MGIDIGCCEGCDYDDGAFHSLCTVCTRLNPYVGEDDYYELSNEVIKMTDERKEEIKRYVESIRERFLCLGKELRAYPKNEEERDYLEEELDKMFDSLPDPFILEESK